MRQIQVEYAVRGHFLMSNEDKFGRNFTYYVPYKTMLRDVPDEVEEEISIFEGNVACFRENEEEESESDGEESESE